MRYYTLVHSTTGYNYGMWSSYEAAENHRNMKDDWINWSVVECE